ncbi:MAG: sulfatase [Candidatus Omnitrophica bacterium]|nr:sulfatase [Candidatus Omnitrophota bacterium]
MHSVDRKWGLLLVTLLILFISGPLLAGSWPEKPNIVLILADDLGWSDVSFMGSQYYETPHLDQLAREGMKFTNAYTNAPNCAPTRACLMTGLYTPRHGIFTVGTSERGESRNRKLIPIPNKTELDPRFTTLPEVLKAAGYHTASIGKWHLGKGKEGGPQAHGFDLNIGGDNEGRTRSHFAPYHNPNLEEGPDGEYLTDRLTDEAIHYIEAHQSSPFFLYLPHYAVHTPIQAKEEKIEKYRHKPPHGGQNNPTYAAMIESLDEGVGRIMETLDRLDLRRKTLVIFFSDNGGHGGITSNAPLRGMKGMLYEGGIRVPLVLSLPGTIAQDSVSDTPVIGIDFFPTLLEIAGVAKPADLNLDGLSFASLLLGEGQPSDRSLFWHFPGYLQMFEGGEGVWRTTPVGVIRKGGWKLMEFFEDGNLELYNLEDDLGEQHNLIDDHHELAQELLSEMRSWRKKTGAKLPNETNPDYVKN